MAGQLTVADIGIPSDLVEARVDRGEHPVELLPGSGRLALPRRPGAAHKGDFGRILILGGSEGYTGAPLLAARGALRAGAGLDIGGTLLGMHLRPVAVPVRLRLSRIGEAGLLCARTRPKYIGGSRAAYLPGSGR